MAKKTNKTSHVLNLITGSQPPVASSGETQPSSSASGETQQEGSAAEEPVRVPSANVTVVDPREEGKLAEEIQKNLIQELEKEKQVQQAILKIKRKYGKNAVLKGTNLLEGATTIERNRQIGGHKA